MAMRIHEIHPSLVHFPLALVPAALLCDLAGRLAGSRALMTAGAKLMPIAAASGAAAAVAGLVAQGSVEFDDEAHAVLATHRNLNLGLVLLTAALSAVRRRSRRPGIAYLAAGLAGVAAMNYTAYLGGKLVYHHGVGVEKAGGVQASRSPEIRWSNAGAALRASIAHGGEALRHTVDGISHGEIAPTLTHER
jgi:uncharacterized membrane protein